MAEAAVAAEEERGNLVQEEQEAEYDEGKYCLNVTLCVKAERREVRRPAASPASRARLPWLLLTTR